MSAAQPIISQTITSTAPSAPSATAPIHQTLGFASLPKRIRPETDQLIKDLIASNLFSAKGEEVIKKWGDIFHAKYLRTLDTDVEKEKACKALYFLVVKLYQPSHRKDPNAISLLDPLIDKVKSVLLFLPPIGNHDPKQKVDEDSHNKGIDEFIEHMKELPYFKRRVEEISVSIQEQMKKLEASEKKRREELQEAFDTLKGIIAELNKTRADNMSSISNKLALLRSRVNAMTQQLIGFGIAMSTIGQKLDRLGVTATDLTHQMGTRLRLKGDGQ